MELAIYQRNVCIKTSMYGIILEHVDHVIGIDEGIIDSDYLNFGIEHRRTENQTTDSAKSINANLNCHVNLLQL